MKHQSLLYGIIIILVGVVIIQFGNTKPNEYVVGPSQKEIDRIEKELIKSEQLRVEEVFQVTQLRKADSIKHATMQRKSLAEVHSLKKEIIKLRANVTEHTPDSTARVIQEEIIELQEEVILNQQSRIHNDSLHILGMYENFNKQLALHAQEVKYLNERLALKDSEIASKDAIIKRKRVGGVVKIGIITGLLVLLAL